MKSTGERQIGTELRDIAPDHVNRYRLVRDYERGKSFIDIGCGVGYGTFILGTGAGRQATGYDIDIEAVNYARQHWNHPNVSFWSGDVSRPEAVTGWADAAVAFE